LPEKGNGDNIKQLPQTNAVFHKYLDYEIATPAFGRLTMTLKPAKRHCEEQSGEAISAAHSRSSMKYSIIGAFPAAISRTPNASLREAKQRG